MKSSVVASLALLTSLTSACIIMKDGDSDTGGGSTGSGSTGATTGSTTSATTGSGSASGGTSAGTTATTTGSDTGTAGSSGGHAGTCGWGDTGVSDPAEGYVCGGSGEDPNGVVPLMCPDGLVENDPCGTVNGVGCCDANGDLWYCTDMAVLYRMTCG
jgi:hypothetical protein